MAAASLAENLCAVFKSSSGTREALADGRVDEEHKATARIRQPSGRAPLPHLVLWACLPLWAIAFVSPVFSPGSTAAVSRCPPVLATAGNSSGAAFERSPRDRARAAAGAPPRQVNTSWIVQSIRSRFGARGTAVAAAAAAGAASMGSMQAGRETATQPPAWRLKRSELRKIYNSYAVATEKEAALLTVPTEREKLWVPQAVRVRRAELVEQAKRANAAFLETLVADLPVDPVESVWKSGVALAPASDGTAGEADNGSPVPAAGAEECHKDVLEIKHYPGVKIGSQAYASMGSLLLHLFRDWSSYCEHVNSEVYAPIVSALLAHVPRRAHAPAPTVMVPGAGLGRLAYEIALKGYEVEANEYSGVFCTVADWLFNRCSSAHTVYPLAHVFSENRRASDQYLNVSIPSPMPGPGFRQAAPEVSMR